MTNDGPGMRSQGAQPTEWTDGSELPPDLLEEQKAVLLNPGDVVAERFEVAEQLGFGGMGAVYKVTDRMTGQERALKVMLPSLLKSDAARERFVAEVTISQELSHEGIVRVHDLGEDPARGFRFFTMEYIEGKTLHRVLSERGGKLPVDEALSVTRQICDALEYAHRTTIHRDLKPQNVMVRPDGRVKVLDFGLAKLMSPGRLTKSSMALGTAYYQAPEQSVHLKELDPRADIYSLGVMLYEMLTGKLPLGMAKPPSQINPALPKHLDEPVSRCLESEPEDRYPGVAALREALGGKVKAAKHLPVVPVVAGVVGVLLIAAVMAGMLFARPSQPGEREKEGTEREQRIVALTGPPSEPSEGASTAADETVQSPSAAAPSAPNADVPALSAEEAQRLQRDTAPDGEITKTVDLGDGVTMEFMWIPPGEFMMGSPDNGEDAEDDEKPVHKVTITKGFWMGKYEVTQAQWQAVMESNPANFTGDSNPVEKVSWDECQQFLGGAGGVLRLPTEAEWEYACRAGTTTKYSFGDDEGPLGEYAWCSGNGEAKTHPVGQKKPNAWGLHDVHGNVWEWCQDRYGAYPGAPVTDPKEPTSGPGRAFRGGGWSLGPTFCRSAVRGRDSATNRYDYLGLRAVLRQPPKSTDTATEVPALSTEEAQRLQRETAPDGEISKTVDLGDGVTMEFMWIPPGEFMMGSEDSISTKPLHRVTISKGFWMGKNEVTQEQWEQVMEARPPSRFESPENAADKVSWHDCERFMGEAGRKTGLGGFRLPSEAEWEYACRAGTRTRYGFGDDERQLTDHAWCTLNSTGVTTVHPAGAKKSNAWGLHDMHGNVYEWCLDWFDAGYYGKSLSVDPVGPDSGTHAALRGGCSGSKPSDCSSAARTFGDPSERKDFVGCRVVLWPGSAAETPADVPALSAEEAQRLQRETAPLARSLKFPEDTEYYASVFVQPWNSATSWAIPLELPSPWKEFDDAKGVVSIPAGMGVGLKLAGHAQAEPQVLEQIGPDDIQCLQLNLPSVGPLLPEIARLKGLRVLRVTGYSGSVYAKDLVHLSGLDRLENLEIYGMEWLTSPDDSLRHLAGCKALRTLILEECWVEDTHLQYLASLKALKELHLGGNNGIRGDGLERLSALNSLETLDLEKTGLMDGNMKHLSRLVSLRSLNISSTQVSDLCFGELTALPSLETLDISGTKVTDASADHLAGMKSLKELIHGKCLTNEALTRLQRALPNCHFRAY